jgi:hypothetical protein
MTVEVNNEPERMLKETFSSLLEVLSGHLPGGAKENRKKLQDGLQACRDSDWESPSTSQKRYRLSHLAR